MVALLLGTAKASPIAAVEASNVRLTLAFETATAVSAAFDGLASTIIILGLLPEAHARDALEPDARFSIPLFKEFPKVNISVTVFPAELPLLSVVNPPPEANLLSASVIFLKFIVMASGFGQVFHNYYCPILCERYTPTEFKP